MTSSLRSRLAAASLDQLALLVVAAGFILLGLDGLLDGHGALYFLSAFLSPIVNPSLEGYGIVEFLFAIALAMAAIAALRRTMRIWGTPAIEAGAPASTRLSWRERAARAAAVLGERRGDDEPPSPGPAEPAEPAALLLGSGASGDEGPAPGEEAQTPSGGWTP